MLETYGSYSLPNRYGNMNKAWDAVDPEVKKQRMKHLHAGGKAWYAALSAEDKLTFNAKKSNNRTHIYVSKIEFIIREALTALGISFTPQKFVSNRNFDILLTETNILIEVQGDYWHANPILYNPDDIVNYGKRKITAEDRWAEDVKKAKIADNYGYIVIMIWEYDIKKNKNDITNFVRNILAKQKHIYLYP